MQVLGKLCDGQDGAVLWHAIVRGKKAVWLWLALWLAPWIY